VRYFDENLAKNGHLPLGVSSYNITKSTEGFILAQVFICINFYMINHCHITKHLFNDFFKKLKIVLFYKEVVHLTLRSFSIESENQFNIFNLVGNVYGLAIWP
jgi:hypothetical protein